ncbi:hypothetical protein GCM10007962_04440 [Yeosuana aromativorans]|uniref:Cytochrome c domain-containing protein n=1 Tax=Yeosuana aromativorans TaxID=288019 RepID=A0A8J3BD95_9FLAO|nr:cytochrome c [Yeosuana aromativorans]GGK13234.1 hypothetical protein GCM10007962_04440 [Yeosuana aromativorans]
MSKLVSLVLIGLLIGCGGKDEKKKASFSYEKKATTTTQQAPPETKVPASKKVNLTDKGVGPITSVELNAEIDQAMVAHGQEIYNKMCTACHRPTKKFIGPAQAGVMERRTPEWVMNMILNPEGMLQNDPLAKELLAEFNGAPMANQNLTQEEARAVLEYFRTLK